MQNPTNPTNPTKPTNPTTIPQKYNKKSQILNLSTTLNYYCIGKCADVCMEILLSGQEDWTQVKQLELDYCGIDDGKAKSLEHLTWPNLHTLFIRHNLFSAPGFYSVFVLGKFQNLSRMWLGCNNIGSIGTKMLIKSDFPKLTQLHLQSANLNNQGVKHLSKATHWPLNCLLIYYNYFTTDAYLSISQFKWNLKVIWINQTEMTEPINALYMVLTNWKNTNRICMRMESQGLKVDINQVLVGRYGFLY